MSAAVTLTRRRWVRFVFFVIGIEKPQAYAGAIAKGVIERGGKRERGGFKRQIGDELSGALYAVIFDPAHPYYAAHLEEAGTGSYSDYFG
jgi:hypothetical protein